MIGTAIVLIPPLVINMLVLMIGRVIPLDVGIILSSLIYEEFHLTATLKRIGKTIHHLFYEEGELTRAYITSIIAAIFVMHNMVKLCWFINMDWLSE